MTKNRPSQFLFFILFLFTFFSTLQPAQADFDLQCYLKEDCDNDWRSSSANPSTGSQLRINPSAVPTEQGYGIEGLFYNGQVDVALVRGNGKIGAAISPSNSEETFFGPPGFELQQNYLLRKKAAEKFPNQKYTLAAAINLLSRNGSGFRNYSLKFGLMGKYNKFTKSISPGAGLSAVWGPFTLGFSGYGDEAQIQEPLVPSGLSIYDVHYTVQTYNFGIFLSSLILDYSHLRLKVNDDPTVLEVDLATASLLISDFIFTASRRSENSARLAYNYETKQLQTQQIKEDYFGGVQYRLTKNLMLGVFYNYYLLHEASFSATILF